MEDENMSYKTIIENLAGAKHLYLDSNHIGENDAKSLAEALKNLKIIDLKIHFNKFLRDIGTKYIAESIKYSFIETLSLRGVCMGDEGVKHLAQCLKNSKVRELYLCHNQISDDGAKSLAQVLEYTRITLLKLEGNHMGIEGAQYINGILHKTQISELAMQIHLTEKYDTRYISYWSPKVGEIHMDFESNKIGVSGAKFINETFRNIPISKLGLASGILEADDAENLAEAFKNRKIIELYSIDLMEADNIQNLIQAFKDSEIVKLRFPYGRLELTIIENLVEFLREIKIVELSLSENFICDDGLEYLAPSLRNNTISRLDLTSNNISFHGIKYLTEILKDSSITELILLNNSIRSEGAKYLAEALKFSPMIKLDLEENIIEDEGAIYIIQALKDTQITRLNLHNNCLNDEYGKYLAENLKYSQINTIFLSYGRMGDEGVKHLAQGLKGSQVQVLDLCLNKISDDGAKYLFQALEYTQVTDLDLNFNDLSPYGAQYINEMLHKTKISNLTMSFDDLIYKADLDAKDFHINLKNNRMGFRTAEFINKTFQDIPISKLEFAFGNLIADDTECLAEAFEKVKIMKLLARPMEIADNIHYLIYIFKDSNIAQLDLTGVQLKSMVVKKFLEEIKVIDLCLNYIHEEDKFLKHFVPSLKNNTILNLEMTSIHISDNEIKFLAEVLKGSHITKLNLSSNDIGDEGAKYLADGLKFSQIRSINLSYNLIQDAGYRYLKNIINDTFVTEINLEGNFIHELCSSNKPYIISRNTCLTLADEIIIAFESVVTFNLLNDEFEFSINKNQSCPSKSIDQYVFLIKTLNHDPILKVQIFDKICRKKTDYFDFVIMDKINEFVESLSERFNTFFNSELLSLMELSPDYDYVNLVRQFEDSKLYDIVKNLLSHRTLYYVDENDEILHPYIYQMLYKYDMTLYNEKLEPCKREKIISYYQNYLEINDAQKVIDLLRSVSLEHKQ